MTIHRKSASGMMAVALLLAAAGCELAEPPPPPPPPAVVTARPVVGEVIEWDDYTGRLEAVEAVEVRAQVSGYLQAIHFQDGQMVERGDLLFTIDPRPYEAERDRAEAQLEQARARVELAERELTRSAQLLRRNAASKEEFDIKQSELRQARATVAEAEATLEKARLDVEFTAIKAPVSGRIGRHLITEGNLINGQLGEASLLTTIVSLDPIHCYFDADERAYLKYVRLRQQGVRPSAREQTTLVLLQLGDEQDYPHRGVLDFIDNRLDLQTGTIRGRAVLPNPDLALAPGLFAKVRLPGSVRYEAVLVPDSAIILDQTQAFVYLVDEDDTAHRRPIETGPRVAGLRIVRAGLSPEDRVVIEGIQALRQGAEVRPEPGEVVVDEELWAREMPLEDIHPDSGGKEMAESARGAAS